MYLMTCTRPDLAYPLSILARYVAPRRHRPEHMAAAKRVLCYLCSTSGLGLVLGGRRPVVLTSHADASWADDQATQRSSQGYTFSLGSGSVSWRSTRSSSVLGSSCEAEIYAGAMAAQELRWLTYLLTDLGEQPCSPLVLYVDNKAMLALCREHRLEHRTKHIALRYFLARELQQRGQLRLAYVASQANTADIFTKALPPGDHQRFCTMLACFALLDWSRDLLFSPTLPMGVFLLVPNSFLVQSFLFLHNSSRIPRQVRILLLVFFKPLLRESQKLNRYRQQPLVLEVICNGRRLQALVDSGASHSVCDRGTLEKIGESLEETQFTATMVDGTKLPIHGKSTLQLQIGALRWMPTLPITNIKGLDFILGRDFLKRFNPEIDWVNRKTCIYNNRKRVELRSWTDTGSVPETTLARFERTVNESNTSYLALVMAAAKEEVLEQYKDIMPDDLPAGVPPARTHEHEIVEEPGAKLVSLAPYRLSPTELTDMKKQIEYLLDRQLIRPSTSPYGAPVLFTPKPDGSLRMCINYRALNKQTALTTAPVLILPDPDRDYVVEEDASNQAVGAVLMQDHGNGLQPIAYLSKKLHGA
ncbi:unnamed protein product [Closterium sp. NIES-53]